MSFHQIALSVAVLALALALVGLVATRRRADDGIDTDQLNSALSQSLADLQFSESVSRIEGHAKNVEEFHENIRMMLRSPRERGDFGEAQLDVILGDHLPRDLYGTGEQVVGNKIPDAHIRSPDGVICIDSKFPLDNYERYLTAEDRQDEERAKAKFRGDVARQLEKIANDYVRPEDGTTPFAFAFIPSEAVYYHLVSEEYDLLRQYSKRGVQVVSPLTFGQKLELIKAGVQAKQLSEEAERVQDRLETLAARLDGFQDDWTTLRGHVRNAENKAADVDERFDRLKSEFERVEDFSAED